MKSPDSADPVLLDKPPARDRISTARRDAFQAADGMAYDVAILGAGISGSRIFISSAGKATACY